MELTRYKSIGKYHRNEEESGKASFPYLLHIADSIHKLGGSSLCPVYHLNPGEEIEDGYSQFQREEIQINKTLDAKDHEDNIETEGTKSGLYFEAAGLSPKSFSEEKIFNFYDTDSKPQPKLSKSAKETLQPDSKQNLVCTGLS